MLRTLWYVLYALVKAQLEQNSYLSRPTIADLEIAKSMLKERLK